MPHFGVYKKCELKKENVTTEQVAHLLKRSISKYYNENDITVTPTGLSVKGNLKSMWERAITKANVQIKIEDNQLFYYVDGTSSLGRWPWVWWILGFFTGFFFIWFLIDLVEYLLSRDRPKQYFEETFKLVSFELCREPDS